MKRDPLPNRVRILREMSESALQDLVIDAAARAGWMVHHDRPSKIATASGGIRVMTNVAGDSGFPDLVMARHGEVIIVEIKSWRNRHTFQPGQKAWQQALGSRIVVAEEVDALCDRLARPPRLLAPKVLVDK